MSFELHEALIILMIGLNLRILLRNEDLNSASVGKGAAYIYIELIVASLSGYILWIVLSKITTAEVIGTASTVVSLGSIFATIVSFGIPSGLPRFLGKVFSDQKLDEARSLVQSSLLLTCVGIAAGSLVILTLKEYLIMDSLGFGLILLCVVFMASTAIATLFRFIIVSSFRTNVLASRQIVSSIIKVVFSIFLILIGSGSFGLTIGYTTSQIITAALFGYAIAKILRIDKYHPRASLRASCKTILIASLPSWIPSSITAVGAQAGTIIVFGASGSSQAGTYFIAFSLFSAIAMITYSLLSAAFPALSAMKDGRKRLTWRIIKISLIISLPLSSSFIFYSEDVLTLLGHDYVAGASSLDILLLSVLPVSVMTGVNTLVYAYGNYKQVLLIGLASSLPRTVLYFILVPFYGGTGAALGYTIGGVAGFIISILIAKKIGFKMYWKELVSMLCVSVAIAFIFKFLDVNYIFGIPSTIIVSYIVLVRMKIVNRLDVQETLGILPFRISNPAIKVLNSLGKKLNRSY